jgi:hypothetical protein
MNSYEKQLEQTIEIESESLPGISLEDEQKPTPIQFQKRGIVQKGPTSTKDKVIFGIAIALILAVGGGLLWWMNHQSWGETVSTTIPKPTVKYYSPLSGVLVADEAATKRAVTAIMIENSPDARPQSGLADADVVFEAVAEGGITRFIALYQNSRPSIIGPVRSLRPYYADWAAGFDPSVAHVGGSPEALTMIRSGNYGVDIDQFFNGSYYWRATDRAAPHNVYTSFDKLDALNASKKHTTSSFTFAPRIDAKPSAKPDASTININVSTGVFSVSYTYNATKNSYDRKEGGAAHMDREKGQISPKVVVALKTSVVLSSDGTHMSITTSGSGQAYVFQNGIVTEGTWSKASPKGQLFLKDATGKEIKLIRGQTWVTTVANDKSVTWQ